MSHSSILMSSLFCLSIAVSGCKSAEEHTQGMAETSATAKSQIRVGMTQADVTSILGSPHIISRDHSNKESWVYDKIATQAHYSSGEGSASITAGAEGLATGKALILGGIGANYTGSTRARSVTQKPLTVIIKFDNAQHVENFNYHSSKS